MYHVEWLNEYTLIKQSVCKNFFKLSEKLAAIVKRVALTCCYLLLQCVCNSYTMAMKYIIYTMAAWGLPDKYRPSSFGYIYIYQANPSSL